MAHATPTPEPRLRPAPGKRWRPDDGQLGHLADYLMALADQSPPAPAGPPPRWWHSCRLRRLPVRLWLLELLRLEASGSLA
jgi:hypothetical protein